MGQTVNRLLLGGLSREMDRNDHFGESATPLGAYQLVLQLRNAQVPGVRVDVDEVDVGAAITRAVGRGDEGVGNGPKQISLPQAERQTGEMQCGGAAVDRDGMVRTDL